jgi:hypothetical protein
MNIFESDPIETGIEEAAAYHANASKGAMPARVAQLTAELRIGERTLDRWRRRRKGLPRTKLGRRVLYSRKSPQVWSSSCEHRGDTQ